MTLTCVAPPIHSERSNPIAGVPPQIATDRLGDHPTAHAVWDSLQPLADGGERSEQFSRLVPCTPLLEVPSYALPADVRHAQRRIFLKADGYMPTGAYKLRGVVAALLAARDSYPNLQTVVAASTGNHAAATALAATMLGLQSVVYMPKGVVAAKVENTIQYGAQILYRDSLDAAVADAEAHGNQPGAMFVHPYDRLEVMAGQGTIGIQVVEQLGKLGVDMDSVDIFHPVGGGGNAAGSAVTYRALAPKAHVHIVQSRGADVAVSNINGRPFDLSTFDPAVDGAAVKSPGEQPMSILRSPDFVHGLHVVSQAEVGEAMAVSARLGHLLEPAGALALAGAIASARHNPRDQRVVVAHGSGINTTPAKVHEFAAKAYTDGLLTGTEAFALISAANIDGRRAPHPLEERARSLVARRAAHIDVRHGCRVISGR